MRRLLLRILLYPVLIYLGSVGVIVLLQDSYLYYPEPIPDYVTTPGDVGIEYQDITIPADDDISIHGWLLSGPGTGPDIIFFHGNAGHLAMRLDMLRYLMFLPEPPARVLIVDYPGYGKSTGTPSEKGLYKTGNAACRYMLDSADRKSAGILIYGRSLGAAVALETALNNPVSGLVLEAPFRSVPAMAREVFPFLPGLGLLATQKFDNESKIVGVTVPLMIFHGTDDSVIPVSHGRYLKEIAPEATIYREIPGGDHDDLYLVGGSKYREAWDHFLALVVSEKKQSSDSRST